MPAPAPDETFQSRKNLLRLHLAAILLHLFSALSGLMLVTSGNPSLGLIAPLFEFVPSPLPGDPFIIPRPITVFSVPILTPLIVVEFITAFFHILYALALLFPAVDQFTRKLIDSSSLNPLRWVEYAITATLLAAFGNVDIGIFDFYYFIRNIFCGIALQSIGHLIELLAPFAGSSQFPADRLYNLSFYFIGLLLNLPMVGVLLYQTFASTTHGAFNLYLENTFPLAFWFNTFGIVASMSYWKRRQFADRFFVERWYLLLSVTTKLTIFWASFATFKQITEDNLYSEPLGVNWNILRICSLSVPGALILAVLVYDLKSWDGNSFYRVVRQQ